MAAVGIGYSPRRGFEAALRLALGVAAALHLAHRHRARRAGSLLRALVRRLGMAPQLAREVERRGGVVVALHRGRGTDEKAFEGAGDAAVGPERAGARAVLVDVLAHREIRHEAAHRAHVVGLLDRKNTRLNAR